MKRVVRWAIVLLLVLSALGVAAFLLFDTALRFAAERKIRAETGLNVRIGGLELGVRAPALTVRDFVLYNPPGFGEGPLLRIAELHFEYDAEALRENRLRLSLVRFHLAELNLVETRDGRLNLRAMPQSQPAPGNEGKARAGRPKEAAGFEGIDRLELSVGKISFSSFRQPDANWERDLRIENETYFDIQSEQDLEAIVLAITLQTEVASLLEQALLIGKEGAEAQPGYGAMLQGVFESLAATRRRQ